MSIKSTWKENEKQMARALLLANFIHSTCTNFVIMITKWNDYSTSREQIALVIK